MKEKETKKKSTGVKPEKEAAIEENMPEEEQLPEETVEETIEDASSAETEADGDGLETEIPASAEAEDSAETEELAEDTSVDNSLETTNEDKAVPTYLATPNDRKNRNLAVTIIIIVIVLLAVIVLVLVNKDEDGAPIQIGKKEGVVAIVGESEITQKMVDGEAALVLYNDYGQTMDALTDEETKIFKNQILVYFLVQAELVKEHLRESGRDVLSDEQNAAVATSIDYYYQAIENSEEVFSSIGVTRDDIKYFMELSEYMAIYQEEILESNPVTEADIEQFYNENQVYFSYPYQISASHILIMDAEHTPEKRAEMEEILARVNEGEDFAELAMQYSEDSGSAAAGGDVGFFGESNNFVPEFSAAALALENVGDVSDIVETTYGYHIIKLTDKQEESIEPIDSVRESIHTYLAELRTGEAAIALKDIISIEYFVEVDPETGEPPLVLPQVSTESLPEVIEQ